MPLPGKLQSPLVFLMNPGNQLPGPSIIYKSEIDKRIPTTYFLYNKFDGPVKSRWKKN
jgi:hypothetical protein